MVSNTFYESEDYKEVSFSFLASKGISCILLWKHDLIIIIIIIIYNNSIIIQHSTITSSASLLLEANDPCINKLVFMSLAPLVTVLGSKPVLDHIEHETYYQLANKLRNH